MSIAAFIAAIARQRSERGLEKAHRGPVRSTRSPARSDDVGAILRDGSPHVPRDGAPGDEGASSEGSRAASRETRSGTLGPPRPDARRTYPFVASTTVHGIPVDIEQRKGDKRSGVDKDGKPWTVTMKAHYGEIRRVTGTEGAKGMDGDRLDVYVGPDPDSTLVTVVDQRIPETGEHDEQKVMLGFSSVADALACYNAQYTKPGFYGGHSTMSVDELNAWISDSDNAGKRIAKALLTVEFLRGVAERTSPVPHLRALLTCAWSLAQRTQAYHWNVTGPLFPQLHALFGAQYDALQAEVDEVAERLKALGEPDVAPDTSTTESETPEASAHDMVRSLARKHKECTAFARLAVRAAERTGDAGTVDLAGRLAREHEKAAWMLNATAVEKAHPLTPAEHQQRVDAGKASGIARQKYGSGAEHAKDATRETMPRHLWMDAALTMARMSNDDAKPYRERMHAAYNAGESVWMIADELIQRAEGARSAHREDSERSGLRRMLAGMARRVEKAKRKPSGPYIGPNGGKWANPEHTRAWIDPKARSDQYRALRTTQSANAQSPVYTLKRWPSDPPERVEVHDPGTGRVHLRFAGRAAVHSAHDKDDLTITPDAIIHRTRGVLATRGEPKLAPITAPILKALMMRIARIHEIPAFMGAIMESRIAKGDAFRHFPHDIAKGAGHKYLRRVLTGKPKPRYRYFYKVTGGKGLGHHDEIQAGAAFRMKDGGKDGHFEVTHDHGDGHVTIKHDESGTEHKIHKDALADMLRTEHAEAIQTEQGKAKAAALKTLAEAHEAGSAKHVERAKAEARKRGASEEETLSPAERQAKAALPAAVAARIKAAKRTLDETRKNLTRWRAMGPRYEWETWEKVGKDAEAAQAEIADMLKRAPDEARRKMVSEAAGDTDVGLSEAAKKYGKPEQDEPKQEAPTPTKPEAAAPSAAPEQRVKVAEEAATKRAAETKAPAQDEDPDVVNSRHHSNYEATKKYLAGAIRRAKKTPTAANLKEVESARAAHQRAEKEWNDWADGRRAEQDDAEVAESNDLKDHYSRIKSYRKEEPGVKEPKVGRTVVHEDDDEELVHDDDQPSSSITQGRRLVRSEIIGVDKDNRKVKLRSEDGTEHEVDAHHLARGVIEESPADIEANEKQGRLFKAKQRTMAAFFRALAAR